MAFLQVNVFKSYFNTPPSIYLYKYVVVEHYDFAKTDQQWRSLCFVYMFSFVQVNIWLVIYGLLINICGLGGMSLYPRHKARL